MNVWRLILAVIVSAAAVVPPYLGLSILSGDLGNVLLPVVLVAALGVSTISVLFIGLPVHLVLVRLNKKRSIYYMLIGFLVPVLVTLIAHPFGEDGMLWIIWQSFLTGAIGALVALVFWKVVTYDSAA